VIEVQGNNTYHGMIWLRDTGGTKDKPITIRGIKVDGKRPVLSGVGSGEFENIVLLLNANHVVMESFEVIGDGDVKSHNYCVVHKADDVTLRDFVINDAKYIKLREISLSYDVPTQFAAKAGAKNAGFTVSARNLHTWSPYTGLDPESEFVSGTPVNVDQAHMPQLASVVFTIRLGY